MRGLHRGAQQLLDGGSVRALAGEMNRPRELRAARSSLATHEHAAANRERPLQLADGGQHSARSDEAAIGDGAHLWMLTCVRTGTLDCQRPVPPGSDSTRATVP